MRKVCPNCNGKGSILVNLGGLYADADCLDCNKTGFIDVDETDEDSAEEPKETDKP